MTRNQILLLITAIGMCIVFFYPMFSRQFTFSKQSVTITEGIWSTHDSYDNTIRLHLDGNDGYGAFIMDSGCTKHFGEYNIRNDSLYLSYETCERKIVLSVLEDEKLSDCLGRIYERE